LGNVRLSYKDNGDGKPEVTDSNDFYPFGMSFVRNSEEDAYFGTGSYFNYKYNGKELQETGMYDYGARFYMPDIGRWYGMDQLGEHPYQIDKSPYAFTWNNPVNLVDQDGLCPDCPDPTKADEIVNHSNGNQYFSVETSGGFKWVQVQDIQEVIVGGGSGSSSGFYLGIGFLGMGSGGSGSASVGGWGYLWRRCTVSYKTATRR